jgi:DNA repair protein RecN (Recombination protein N)
MLTSLYIKDYALIKEVTIPFGNGLNIITGETGAGKSIMLDALNLILGGRAYTDAIARGANKAIVEGVVRLNNLLSENLSELLTPLEIELGSELIIRREISNKGNSRAFINDTPVSLNILKEVGDKLVDLHGQHEHQAILHSDNHIKYLDSFAKTSPLKIQFSKELSLLLKLISEQRTVESKRDELKEKRDFFAFRLKEIDSIAPVEHEDEDIERELNILENSEKVLELTSSSFSKLYDDDNSAYNSIYSAKKDIEILSKIDPVFQILLQEIESALATVEGSADTIRDYKRNIDLDPAKLEMLRQRLIALNGLKRKYGGSLKAVIETREKIILELDLADNFSERLSQLNDSIRKQRGICGVLAEKLSVLRKNSVQSLSEGILKKLSELGINNGQFLVNVSLQVADIKDLNYLPVGDKLYLFNNEGIDQVEFFISTNAGETPKPLVKVASGGEVSRVMLSLKSVLAGMDRIPVLVFDEVDTGVSGRIAQKVGAALKSLSSYHQIIAITHLPQIAAFSDSHFAVVKTESNGYTSTTVSKLSESEKVIEIAKLISGSDVTNASIKSAKELMDGEGLFG